MADVNREYVKAQGDKVKQDVVNILFGVKDVKIEQDAWASLLIAAFATYGAIVRCQMLEMIEVNLTKETLSQELIARSIGALCRELDDKARQLGNQAALIHEVAERPALLN